MQLLKNIEQGTDPGTLWQIVGDLGEGTFGMVHKVKHRQTGKFAAAKIIPVEDAGELEDFVVEVRARQWRHCVPPLPCGYAATTTRALPGQPQHCALPASVSVVMMVPAAPSGLDR